MRAPTIIAVLATTAVVSALLLRGSSEPGPASDEATALPSSARPPEPSAGAPPTSPESAAVLPPLPTPEPLPIPPFDPSTTPRWIAAASGPVPELNQVSLEQDIALAAEVLGLQGRVLFGAGPGSATVQVLAQPPSGDPLRLLLGDLFAPRGGRELRYRATRLARAEPATAETLVQALDHALAGGPEPLLVYLGGHGNLGEAPRFNSISLWEQSELSVVELAERLDRSPRPVQLVVTTCFSGGFAELVFREADESKGASISPRCGLFAAPWDLEATGCDPNPDRAAQEGYGLHFLHALRGQGRDGTPLPIDTLDLDGDRHISLLEAHARARIASESADVPTSTTERWLRFAAPDGGEERAVPWPEEAAVIDALALRVGLVGREAEAYLELQRLGDDIEAVVRGLDDAQLDEDAAYRRAAADLLARWPVLDDPWHPEHAAVVERERAAIEQHLEQSLSYAEYRSAREQVDRLGERLWALRLRSAPYERLTRALDNRKLAARLHAQGGAAWATFEQILACERGRP